MDKYNQLYQELRRSNIQVKQNISLADYTTLHIGGIAKLLVDIANIADIKLVIQYCTLYDVPFYVLGRGSNVLASDEGYDGLILLVSNHFSEITFLDEHCVKVQSGATLRAISDACIQYELGGFEFACGIPGSAGGGVRMNAGAYDGEMKDIIKEVTFLNEDLECITLNNEQLDFAYRHSYFTTHFGIILEVVYQLFHKEKNLIQTRVDELMKRRYDNQPMDKYSAGSTFKRPVGNYASALIRKAGLQGLQVGDAQVSTKHAGFLINNLHATSSEFRELIEIVQEEVKMHSGYELECEIRFLP